VVVCYAPQRGRALVRVFAGHIYGHLEERERLAFLAEARRVGDELVILDSGRPPGAEAEEWQVREMADGTSYTVYKRHFTIDELVAEIGGELLFGGPILTFSRDPLWRGTRPTSRRPTASVHRFVSTSQRCGICPPGGSADVRAYARMVGRGSDLLGRVAVQATVSSVGRSHGDSLGPILGMDGLGEVSVRGDDCHAVGDGD